MLTRRSRAFIFCVGFVLTAIVVHAQPLVETVKTGDIKRVKSMLKKKML